MAQTTESLLIRLDATTEQLRRELRRADDGVQKFDRSVGKRLQKIDQRFQRLGRGIQGVGAALGGLAAAAGARELGRLGTQALNSAEQVQRMADSLGVGVETVQELQFTFSRFGLQQKDVNDALATLADRAQDAIDGTKSIQEDFQAIGISVDQLRGRNPAQLMRLVADAIARTEDPSKRAAAAVRILEDEIGQRLLPLLTQGSQGFDRFAEQANRFGLVLDEALVRKGAEAAGELDTLRLAARSAFDTGVIEGFTSEFDGVEQALSSVTRLSNQFGERLGSALATVTQDADELLQRMENIARLVLGVYGAFKGGTVGGRIAGVPGAIGGALIGGGAGALSPEAMGLMTRGLGGSEQSAEEARLEALREQRDRLVERSRTIANEGESGLTEIDRRITMLNAEIEATERRVSQQRSTGDGGGGNRSGLSIDVPPGSFSGGGNSGNGSPVPAGFPGAEAVTRTNDLVAEQRAELDRIGQKLRNDINPAWARYQQRMQNLQTALEANRISQREFNQLAQQAGQQLNESAAQGTESLRRMQQAADQLGFTFSSAFEDAIVQGQNLQSVLQGLLQDILRIIVRTQITQPLGNALSGALSDGLGSIFSGFFGGGATTGAAVSSSAGGLGQPLPRAGGGPVEAGQSYVVGERGRELFVPQSDGRITPNHQMGGGNVEVHVHNQGDSEVETRRTREPNGTQRIDVLLRKKTSQGIRSGAFDQAMEDRFGIRPQVAKR